MFRFRKEAADQTEKESLHPSSGMFVFTGCTPPLHFGVYVSVHFNNLAAGAFLPPPRSPAKSMREPRSPPLLSHWNDEATSPISLRGGVHPVNTNAGIVS